MRKELIEKVNSLQTKQFETIEQARHYTHQLHELLQEEEERIMEEKRKLDDELWELRHAESKVFDYYLGIR